MPWQVNQGTHPGLGLCLKYGRSPYYGQLTWSDLIGLCMRQECFGAYNTASPRLLSHCCRSKTDRNRDSQLNLKGLILILMSMKLNAKPLSGPTVCFSC